MSAFDDLTSRLVSNKSIVITWIQDWGCDMCHKFGGVKIHATGTRKAHEDGKPVPQETNEEILRMIFEAHRGDLGLCRNPLFRLKLGRQWRFERMTDGRKRMIVMKRDSDPPTGIKEYRWPPWIV